MNARTHTTFVAMQPNRTEIGSSITIRTYIAGRACLLDF